MTGSGSAPAASTTGSSSSERAVEAVLLAVAFDIEVVGPDGGSELTVVVEVGGP